MTNHPQSSNVTPGADEEDVLRVAANSDAQNVASAIARALYERPSIRVRAVGAGAVNQATKAIAISRGYVAPRGLDLFCRPGFETITSNDGDISAITWRLHVS